jgi:hypothetical protein
VSLPEGSEVEVTALKAQEAPATESDGPSLHERMKDFAGVFEDLPADFAENHDH